MAKSSSSKSGSSRIRFIMLEADLNEGDLSQVTQAIQNALRPSQPQVRLIAHTQNGQSAEETSESITLEPEDDLDGATFEPQRKPRASRPRSIKPPKVVEGIDWDGKNGLKTFVEDYDLKTDFERYLVVALWFRDYRDTPAITPGHIYTAYRHMGWPSSIPDFAKPFRNMVTSQLFTGGSKEGFAINQLGEGKIRARKRGA